MEQENKPDFWAVVEVMGHNVFAGRVSDMALGGSSFIRVDVPEIAERIELRAGYLNGKYGKHDTQIPGAPAYTKIIGAGSIYCITPCSEEVATKVADERRQKPVSVVEMPEPKALIAAASEDHEADEDDEDEVPY
jgi:hypothetical protein